MTGEQLKQLNELLKKHIGDSVYFPTPLENGWDYNKPCMVKDLNGEVKSGTHTFWASSNKCSAPFVTTVDFDEMKIVKSYALW